MHTTSRTPRSLVVTLWATLFALVGTLFGMFAAPSPAARTPDFSWLPEGVAQGAVVSQTGGLTCMTTDIGNEDLLLVLDSRNEELFVYRTDSKAGMQLLQRYPVPQMFVDARGRSQGR
ncbi:MAG: hypothetical protein U0637_04575 [Phycisphaerales bacterium]